MAKKKKKFPYVITLLLFILVGTASWAFYSLTNNLVSGAMNFFAEKYSFLSWTAGENAQLFAIIILTMLVLITLGTSFKKSFEKIIGK